MYMLLSLKSELRHYSVLCRRIKPHNDYSPVKLHNVKLDKGLVNCMY